jgi:hypothetical protein
MSRIAGRYHATPTIHTSGQFPYVKVDEEGGIIKGKFLEADVQQQLLASAARTTTQTMDIVNSHHFPGAIFTIDVTAVVATPSLVPSLQYYDTGSAGYITVHTFTAIEPVGAATYFLVVHPTASLITVSTESLNFVLPRPLRFLITPADADSCTYSVGLSFLTN